MTLKASRLIGCVAASVLLLLSACDGGSTEAEQGAEVEEDPVENRFGDPYDIVLGRAPADPDMPPAVAEDTLRAMVSYTGGCADHDFELRQETRDDTTRIWLHHDAHGDDCEAMIADEVMKPLSLDDLPTETVVLENPRGGPPFMLRW